MREIGSEFWDIPLSDSECGFVDEQKVFFLSGRAALKFIIEDIKIRGNAGTVALPSWCCDSMILPFCEAGFDVRFYTVSLCDGGVYQNFDEALDSDVILVMDYFGYDSGSVVDGFEGIVIRDLTHSVFSKNYDDADYYFGSLRKWAGFFTGGFAYRKNGIFSAELPGLTDEKYIELRNDAMLKKARYISGESISKEYLDVFSEAEDRLERGGIFGAADEDLARMRILDVELLKKRRRENAFFLLERLADIAIFPNLTENECPLFVPIAVPNGKRDELRRYLIENEIYCPIHWPFSEYHRISGDAKKIYDNELSLVCDQRYGISDMARIVEIIDRFWRE